MMLSLFHSLPDNSDVIYIKPDRCGSRLRAAPDCIFADCGCGTGF